VADLRNQIALSAIEALRMGGDDDVRILRHFEETAPVKIRLPSVLGATEARGYVKLLKRVGEGQLVLEGDVTTGFVSAVAITRSDSVDTNRCTGFLISPDVVLTAAHCIEEGFSGGVFLHDVNGVHAGPAPNVNRIHEDFGEPVEFANDIAIIRLSGVISGVDIYPIADKTTIEKASDFRIVGYGKHTVNAAISVDPIKRTAPVSVSAMPRGTDAVQRREFLIGDPMVDDGDACDGDSGGPVVVEVGGNYQLAGLISRGINPLRTLCGEGTICLRLDEYVGWIDQSIQVIGGRPRPS
jgi:secreted trypsin-like serine protease